MEIFPEHILADFAHFMKKQEGKDKEFKTRAMHYGAVGCVALVGLRVVWGARKRIARAYARMTMSESTRVIVGTLNSIEQNEFDPEDEDEDEFEVGLGLGELVDEAVAVNAPQEEGEEGALVARTPAPIRARRRRPNRRTLVFNGCTLTGRAADVAQRAKLAFGDIPRTDYNCNSVRRWLNRELHATVRNLRTVDFARWIKPMELYVFWKSDDDIAMEQAITELEAMGRIRNGRP